MNNVYPNEPLHLRLDLPSGATIMETTFYFVDDMADKSLDFRLLRYDPRALGEPVVIQSGTSSTMATDPGVQSLVLQPNLLVDNSQYAYILSVTFEGNGKALLLTGVRVGYTLPTTYLPSIHR